MGGWKWAIWGSEHGQKRLNHTEIASDTSSFVVTSSLVYETPVETRGSASMWNYSKNTRDLGQGAPQNGASLQYL